MTDALADALDTAAAQVEFQERTTDDLGECYETVRRLRAQLGDTDRRLTSLQRRIVLRLRGDNERTWAEIGTIIGTSGSRAEAIAKER